MAGAGLDNQSGDHVPYSRYHAPCSPGDSGETQWTELNRIQCEVITVIFAPELITGNDFHHQLKLMEFCICQIVGCWSQPKSEFFKNDESFAKY